MKYVLGLVALLATHSAQAAQAQPLNEQFCGAYGALAHNVMTFRQEGMPMDHNWMVLSTTIRETFYDPDQRAFTLSFSRKLIDLAYAEGKVPAHSVAKTASAFADERKQACLNGE